MVVVALVIVVVVVFIVVDIVNVAPRTVAAIAGIIVDDIGDLIVVDDVTRVCTTSRRKGRKTLRYRADCRSRAPVAAANTTVIAPSVVSRRGERHVGGHDRGEHVSSRRYQ